MGNNVAVQPLELKTFNHTSILSRADVFGCTDQDTFGKVDASLQILNLIEFNGFEYKAIDGIYELEFYAFEIECLVKLIPYENYVVIISNYPFSTCNNWEKIQEINEKLLMGCVYIKNGIAHFKTTADLFDGYYAYEAIARALEYNVNAAYHYVNEFILHK